jgi:isopenicillin N synthase-like dioxygenase
MLQSAKPGQLRGGEYTDNGLLTILNGENVPGGLQVKTRRGEWLVVETDPSNFVCNIDDLLMRWTNDRWVSNVHRVVIPPSSAAGAKRLSMAFFHHTNYDALVQCIAPPGKAKYPPVPSGDYRDLKYRQTHLMETPFKATGARRLIPARKTLRQAFLGLKVTRLRSLHFW